MPLYEYYCKKCDQDVDLIRKFSDTTEPLCPVCQQPDLMRKRSLPSFHLKGGGWYKDNYSKQTAKDKKNQPQPTPDKQGKQPAASKNDNASTNNATNNATNGSANAKSTSPPSVAKAKPSSKQA